MRALIDDNWGLLKRWRRRVMGPIYRICDLPLPGLGRLRTHILICGYPRAGTTMMLAMLEYAYPHARCFGRELRGWRAASYCWRNHEVMISKSPTDLVVLDRFQAFYQKRRARLKAIILVRDPRDVLTSWHPDRGGYWANPRVWRNIHSHYDAHRDDPDVLVLRYEQVVEDLAGTQQRIEAFTQEKMERPMSEFHTEYRQEFEQGPLNGWRAVDSHGIGRWAQPEHADRIRQLLAEYPELPDILVEMGYERDKDWIKGYAAGESVDRAGLDARL